MPDAGLLREALRDTDGSGGDAGRSFHLKGTIADTHFAERERQGRLLPFVARLAKDRHTAAITGLAVDQDRALLANPDIALR